MELIRVKFLQRIMCVWSQMESNFQMFWFRQIFQGQFYRFHSRSHTLKTCPFFFIQPGCRSVYGTSKFENTHSYNTLWLYCYRKKIRTNERTNVRSQLWSTLTDGVKTMCVQVNFSLKFTYKTKRDSFIYFNILIYIHIQPS